VINITNFCYLKESLFGVFDAIRRRDFHSRMLAFHGACGEPPRLIKPAGVSPVPLIPQDKEGFDSVTSHEENVIFHFRGVSHLALQSTIQRCTLKKYPKATILENNLEIILTKISGKTIINLYYKK
jgi:hypothetical protein